MPCTSACMRSCPSKLGSSASSSRRVSAALAFLAVGIRSLSLFWWPQGLEAKEKERVWVRNQNAGELDDTKLVDGATGERNIFKKRGNNNPMFGNVQMHPKRAINDLLLLDGHSSPGVLRCSGLRFLMDVSSSMSRFNGTDRRLDRMCASTVMIMEAFQGERTGCVCEVWAGQQSDSGVCRS